MNNENKSVEVKTKNITLSGIIGWIIRVIVGIIGIGELVTDPIPGIFLLLGLAITLPSVNRWLKEKRNINLSRALRWTMFLILFIISFSITAKHAKQNLVPNTKVSDANQPATTIVSKSYQQVFTLSGNGTKKSEPFTITGSRFKIKYDCKGDLCQAFAYRVGSQIPQIIMNSAEPVKDETIIYGTGDYYISANTMGSFTMTVEDYK